MSSTTILIQYVSQNIALLCCALFAGAATYVSLVEQPSLEEGGTTLADSFILAAQPRPVVFQTSFGVGGSLAGILAGVAGGSIGWFAGGVVLAAATLVQIIAVRPLQRDLVELDLRTDPPAAAKIVARLARLHAGVTLAALGSLFTYIISA